MIIASYFRVLELEKMKENVNSRLKHDEKPLKHVKSSKITNIKRSEADESDDDDDDDDISDVDEYLDWRSKKAYK